jgi:hypothetical protein
MSKLNDRLSVGQNIAPPLRALEGDFESAFANAGRLMTAIGEGRLKAKTPFGVGLKAIEQINLCLGSMVDAAKSIDALHGSLDQLRADFGLPVTAFGDYGDKPSVTPVEDARPLRIAS